MMQIKCYNNEYSFKGKQPDGTYKEYVSDAEYKEDIEESFHDLFKKACDELVKGVDDLCQQKRRLTRN